LERLGVEVLTSTRVEEITDHGVLIAGADSRKRTLAADTVVVATGVKPNRKVQEELQPLAREVYLAGDCLVPGDIRSSIHQGHMIGRMLF
jgi:NADH dehydrogenase FAD-containing subunit